METTANLLLAHDVAKRLGLTPGRVKQLAKEGALHATRTVSGVFLFDQRDVERLRRERETRRGKAAR